jgi:hypothetical protein
MSDDSILFVEKMMILLWEWWLVILLVISVLTLDNHLIRFGFLLLLFY